MSSIEPRGTQPPASAHPGQSVPPGATIVVADDDRITRQLLCDILTRNGYTTEAFEDGQAAVERVAQGGVDLVLLDVVMPRLSGLEACRFLKNLQRDVFLPVVLLTVRSDTQSRVEGLKIGADDYVAKPFDDEELLARVEAMLRIRRLHNEVARARAKLEQLSVHDELTGLFNYRYLHNRLNEEFRRSERYQEPLACMVVDIDRLQDVNQLGGRDLGNKVLVGVADIFRRSLREVDVVARFGGDEFFAILPSTHFAGSVTVAERLWKEIGTRPFVDDSQQSVRVSVSIGVALFPSRDIRTKDRLLRAAETALRNAKRDGGNRVCVFQQEGFVYTPVAGSERGTAP